MRKSHAAPRRALIPAKANPLVAPLQSIHLGIGISLNLAGPRPRLAREKGLRGMPMAAPLWYGWREVVHDGQLSASQRGRENFLYRNPRKSFFEAWKPQKMNRKLFPKCRIFLHYTPSIPFFCGFHGIAFVWTTTHEKSGILP